MAQRALVSYLRSVFLQPNRRVFDVTQLPAAEYAYSMGLPTAPKLRFLKKAGAPGGPDPDPDPVWMLCVLLCTALRFFRPWAVIMHCTALGGV